MDHPGNRVPRPGTRADALTRRKFDDAPNEPCGSSVSGWRGSLWRAAMTGRTARARALGPGAPYARPTSRDATRAQRCSRRTARARTDLSRRSKHLTVGDRVLDGAPDKHCAFSVADLEPNRRLVLHSREHLPPGWEQRYGAGDRLELGVHPRGACQVAGRGSSSVAGSGLSPDGSRRSMSRSSSPPTSSWAGRCCAA